MRSPSIRSDRRAIPAEPIGGFPGRSDALLHQARHHVRNLRTAGTILIGIASAICGLPRETAATCEKQSYTLKSDATSPAFHITFIKATLGNCSETDGFLGVKEIKDYASNTVFDTAYSSLWQVELR